MTTISNEFDLQPAPRILPMLGEINLAQWRCLAELVDNSIDSFLSAPDRDVSEGDPEITVNTPTRDDSSGRLTVSDNGPGMAPDRLEMAVRAGWSGNTPIGSLGMFGMGFNIATARLGSVTTVWTSRSGDEEECGLQIDFDQLRQQRHFRTPRLNRPKLDPDLSGTTITIENLKPEQRVWLSKPGNRSGIKKHLSRVYSTMLRPGGVPIFFRLQLNGRPVSAINHCVWDESRFVDTPRYGPVHAVQTIDRRLPDRPFCITCWQWLPAIDDRCPSCGRTNGIVQRKRHVHGWIGLQRYLSSEDYGIDFLRHGRKIEIGSRDLFYWQDPGNNAFELEYPIDDPRQRGRFVGEIHLDHCRVTYMKDRFDRTDPAWEEMVGIVRGQGPLQPQKASGLGFENNDAPLFKLYQAYRRSSPHRARAAGEWRKVIVVKDNERAQDMARRFYEGDSRYQTDEQWWALVEEEDNRLLTPASGPSTATPQGPASGLSGFTSATGGSAVGATNASGATPVKSPVRRTPISSLTREYQHNATGLRWDVKAFEAMQDDPDLGEESRPWDLQKKADGSAQFLVNTDHVVFRSATMTYLDALLSELAYRTVDFMRDQLGPLTFAAVLAALRADYAGPSRLDPPTLRNEAEVLFNSIAIAWSRDIGPRDTIALFSELPSSAREEIYHRMAVRSVSHSQQAISDGRFLEYASSRTVVEFIVAHPDLFFDGRCWPDSYADLDYGHPSANDAARRQLVEQYESLLRDASWLSEQDLHDLETSPRARLLRAMLAVELLSTAVDNS